MPIANLDILYEDNHLLVVNKPSGLLVQGDSTGDETLLDKAKKYIKITYNKPGEVFLGLPHRIDRPTSGLVLLARTSKALIRLNNMFKNKEIQKTYWAVVQGKLIENEVVLHHFLVKNQKKNKSKAYNKKVAHSSEAILTYKLMATSHKYCLLEVNPKTGRHHQIRVQLASTGLPIKGDVKYGFNRANKDKSIHLHARTLQFLHPVKKELFKLTAPCPKEDALWECFEKGVR